MPAYEYLRITAQSETNWASIRTLPEATRPAVTFEWIITAVDAADPGEGRRLPSGTRVMTLLNDLGRQGWDLISSTVTDTIVVDESHGYFGVGTPIGWLYTLKRALP